MKKFLRSFGFRLFKGYINENFDIVFSLLNKNKNAKILDLGCADGTMTFQFANKVETKDLYGIEVFDEQVDKAKKHGIKCKKSDLNKKLPYNSLYFDILISHFSLEHLVNIEGFAKECYRVLKPGGSLIVASDNLNSWLNIYAMVFTFQPFSLTSGIVSSKTIGNPFAFWTGEDMQRMDDREKDSVIGAGTHIKVISTRAAVELFNQVGFRVEKVKGAGYFPFWGIISRYLANLDVYHAHFYIIKAMKR